jgi:enterochelin esterase-like enzyme
VTEIPYVRQPTELPARYAHGPDSFVQPGVPRGTLHEYEWDESRVFPGTRRRYWAYVPAQYTSAEPASLMVCQDAEWYMDLDFEVRAPIVIDNLIHEGEMPVTIVVFVEPSENRNAEYDAFSDTYAMFLLDEIIPAVCAEWAITDDPARWAVCGGSCGGNCAFTVAWFRPDRFRRVINLLGSFAQIPGGNPYPELIRETPPKPLRIFMLAETHDLDWGPDRNWLKENLLVAAALSERGYDFHLVVGDGGHDGNHGGVILPDALRWLWRNDSAHGAGNEAQ